MVRRGIACAAGLIAAGLSILLTLRPLTGSQATAPFILLALAVAIVAIWPLRRVRVGWGVLALALALALMVPITVVARAFGDVDMLAFLFHLEFGTGGAGLGGLEREVAVAGFVFATTLAGLVIASAAMRRRWAIWAMVAVALVVNPALRGAVEIVTRADAGNATLLPDLVEPDLVAPDAGARPDVVVIYAEGMDLIFTDRDRFGDAMDRLMALAGPGAIQLTGIGSMVGTDWSVSGVAASLCGVPILPNGLRFQNNFEGQEDFMSDVTCLGDVLAERGYATHFVVGADAIFGGLEHFLRSHGVTDQTDLEVIRGMVPAEEFDAAFPGWVLDDQMTMEIALRRHAELMAAGDPMFLSVETMGPHGREVWLSRRCTESGRAEISDDVAVAVRCTGNQIADFVETLRDAPDARPTLFVILSDHINHNPDLLGPNGIADRRYTAIIIPPVTGDTPLPPLRVIDREAAMIDVFPTMLDILGLIPDGGAAGLGVSLLGEAPTLVERLGREDADDRLARDVALAARLWGE